MVQLSGTPSLVLRLKLRGEVHNLGEQYHLYDIILTHCITIDWWG